MQHDPDPHHRKPIRLRGNDYAQRGAYFITICTHHRECLFGDQVLRSVVETQWRSLPHHFPHVELDEWVVMPNHLHAIIVVTEDARRVDAARRGEAFANARSDRELPGSSVSRRHDHIDLANASPLHPRRLHPSALILHLSNASPLQTIPPCSTSSTGSRR